MNKNIPQFPEEDTTAGMRTIAAQELAILLDKMKLEYDTLVSLYRLDSGGIKFLKRTQRMWRQYVEAELKLVEYNFFGGTICPLQVNARYQELIITRIQDLQKSIEIKRDV